MKRPPLADMPIRTGVMTKLPAVVVTPKGESRACGDRQLLRSISCRKGPANPGGRPWPDPDETCSCRDEPDGCLAGVGRMEARSRHVPYGARRRWCRDRRFGGRGSYEVFAGRADIRSVAAGADRLDRHLR